MILGLLIYRTNCKLCNNRVIPFITTIGTMYFLRAFIAARAQLFTFILFVLTVYFIEKFLDTGKRKYGIGLIIIPIILANSHVAVFPFYFVLYLPYVVEYMIYVLSQIFIIINKSRIESIYKKIQKAKDEEQINILKNKLSKIEEKNNERVRVREINRKKAYKIIVEPKAHIKTLIIIMLICLFTGLLTPLGSVPYTYLIDTMTGNTTQSISEHQPLILAKNINFACTLIIFLILLTFTDSKIKLCDLFMLVGLVLLTFYTRRQESMYAIICVGILNKLLVQWFDKYAPKALPKAEKMITTLAGECIIVCLILLLSWKEYKPKIDDVYITESSYPVKASEWIKENLDVNNIRLYNEYNYGSYLLFEDIPVFIDSRADLYAPEFNEGVTIFDDFLKINSLNKMNMEELFDKYDFTHFIMSSKAKLKIYMNSNQDKYKKIYDDNDFCIYEKI